MMTPTIHMNGTSREDLLEENAVAVVSLQRAFSAVAKAAPNARDYHLQGGDAFGKALAEHDERLKKIDTVRLELVAIANAISDGGKPR